MTETPVLITSQPGIKRDLTKLQGQNYVDGQWVRWLAGSPKKMNGYRRLTDQLENKIYGIHTYGVDTSLYIHTGSQNKLKQYVSDLSGNLLPANDRTPGGLAVSTDNVWSFDVMYDTALSKNTLIAHAAPNLSSIVSTTQGQIFTGDLTAATALTAVTVPAGESAAGGIVVLHPYLIVLGAGGNITWSVPGNPADLSAAGSGSAHVASQKLVAGLPVRGNGTPNGLLWSTNEIVRLVFVGGTTIWSSDVLTTSSSILSSRSVVEFDGIYFWAGVGRFLLFNGVMRELPNTLNRKWFFDNLNFAQRQKVFAFTVQETAEIWWCFPFGTATECTHAVIYNVRENCWYDTELPASGRSSGTYSTALGAPLLTGVDVSDATYKMWQHEYGLDELDGGYTNPIQSFFETNEMTMLRGSNQGPGTSRSLRATFVEPDLEQAGDMTLQIIGRANARAPEVYSEIQTFADTASVPSEELLKFKDTARLMRFRFESNTAGGDYWLGETYAHIGPSDGRMSS